MTAAPLTAEYSFEGPLDLRRTINLMMLWGKSTWHRVDQSGAWYAERTKEGPATVRMRHGGDRVLAEAWGPGAERLIERVPSICGLDNQGVLALEFSQPRLRDLKMTMVGYRTGRTGEVFASLVSTALGQKITGTNARRSLFGIAYRWGERAPGPRDDLRLLPQPRELERRPWYEYSRLGIERKRADLVRRIASRASALGRAAHMSGPDAQAHLEKLPGIGPWTSGVVVGGPLGDPDVVPIGDYHLPNCVSWMMTREPRSTDARMMELLEPYKGLRGMVARMSMASGDWPPKWGPRMAAQDLRDLS